MDTYIYTYNLKELLQFQNRKYIVYMYRKVHLVTCKPFLNNYDCDKKYVQIFH